MLVRFRHAPIPKQPSIVTQAEVLASKSPNAFSGSLLSLAEVEAVRPCQLSPGHLTRNETHFSALIVHDLPPQLKATCGGVLQGNV